MKKFRKLSYLVLLLAISTTILLCSCGAGTDTYAEDLTKFLAKYEASSVYDEQHTPVYDQAIIIIHGMMDGALYAVSEDEISDGVPKRYWGTDALSDKLSTAEKALGLINTVNNLEIIGNIDADGIPVKKLRAGNMTDDLPYDSFGGLKEIYEYCSDRYYDSYDVVCWQYDWRTHLDAVARQLDRFINECGYKKVILIGHSMGCCVSSRYLALGEAQRQKVELFVPYGGPMLGAIDANAVVMEMDKGVSTGFSAIMGFVSTPTFTIAGAAQGMASAYHLMGTEQINATPYYQNGETFFSVDGVYKSNAEWVRFLKDNYAWSKDSAGNTKFFLDTLERYQSELFIDGKHVSTLVNTEYVAAIGKQTTTSIDISSTSKKLASVKTTTLGDSLVTLYSATAGLTWEGDNVPENVHIMENTSHIEMIVKDPLVEIFDKLDASKQQA